MRTTFISTLPLRRGPRPRTSGPMPNVQLDQLGSLELHAALRARFYALPDIEERQTTVSDPRARAMWLKDVGASRPRQIRLPVLARVERIAEKVRAFLERGLDRDAFDLHYHAPRLSEADRTRLRGLVQDKLASSELEEGCDLHRQFATALEGARQTWPRGLIIVSTPPIWTEVERALNATYRPLLRSPLRRR